MQNDSVDIREFARQIVAETKSNSTSNRALLWVTIGATGVFTVLSIVIAIVALFLALSCQQEIYRRKSDNAELKAISEQAHRDYAAARQTLARCRKDRSQ